MNVNSCVPKSLVNYVFVYRTLRMMFLYVGGDCDNPCI